MKLIIFSFIATFLVLSPLVSHAEHDLGTSFIDRENVGWNQLITCENFDTVYYIDPTGSRWVFPNEKTYNTWYPDFTLVVNVDCDDLAQFPLAGVITNQPGTRYVKITSSPTVYAVEPGGILRAIPNETWMETFVGTNWNTMIDDVADGYWPRYVVGEPLDLMEIPNGMTAIDPDDSTVYYFVDGQPKSLSGISYNFRHNDHFKSFTRTQSQAPLMYGRVLTAMREGTRIGSPDEIWVGTPKTSETSQWVEESEGFPSVPILH